MSTDDAYVQADKVGISTDVSGIVQEVAVKDNQHVESRPGPLSARPASIPDRARQRQSQSRADRDVDRGDEAGLQAHAERRRRRAGAGRSRSDKLRSQRDVLATAPFRRRFTTRRATRSHQQEQARISAPTGAVQLAKLGGDPDIPPRSIRNICRRRRRSTRRSASSITPSSRRHSPAS